MSENSTDFGTASLTGLSVEVGTVQVLDQGGDHVDGTVHLEVTADKEPSVGVDHFECCFGGFW
jgi:hypothetical protein